MRSARRTEQAAAPRPLADFGPTFWKALGNNPSLAEGPPRRRTLKATKELTLWQATAWFGGVTCPERGDEPCLLTATLGAEVWG